MRTITVRLQRETNTLDFDLRDLLACIAPLAAQLSWEVHDLECTGQRANELDALAARGLIAGELLIEIAEGINQVIDGEFLGYGNDKRVSVVLHAVDSTCWNIASDRGTVLDALRLRFVNAVDVTDMPV